jgi:hypothetical protein
MTPSANRSGSPPTNHRQSPGLLMDDRAPGGPANQQRVVELDQQQTTWPQDGHNLRAVTVNSSYVQ